MDDRRKNPDRQQQGHHKQRHGFQRATHGRLVRSLQPAQQERRHQQHAQAVAQPPDHPEVPVWGGSRDAQRIDRCAQQGRQPAGENQDQPECGDMAQPVECKRAGDALQQPGGQQAFEQVDCGKAQRLGEGEGGQVGSDFRQDGHRQMQRPIAPGHQQQGGQQDAVRQPENGDAFGHGRCRHAEHGAQVVAEPGGERMQQAMPQQAHADASPLIPRHAYRSRGRPCESASSAVLRLLWVDYREVAAVLSMAEINQGSASNPGVH